MTTVEDPAQRKRDLAAARQRRRRAKAKEAGMPIPHTGSSGPSGGKSTQAARAKRYRQRKRDVTEEIS